MNEHQTHIANRNPFSKHQQHRLIDGAIHRICMTAKMEILHKYAILLPHITLLRINTTNHAIFPLKPFMLHASVNFCPGFRQPSKLCGIFLCRLYLAFNRNMNIFYFYRDINTVAFKHYLLFRIYSYKHQREIFIKYS